MAVSWRHGAALRGNQAGDARSRAMTLNLQQFTSNSRANKYGPNDNQILNRTMPDKGFNSNVGLCLNRVDYQNRERTVPADTDFAFFDQDDVGERSAMSDRLTRRTAGDARQTDLNHHRNEAAGSSRYVTEVERTKDNPYKLPQTNPYNGVDDTARRPDATTQQEAETTKQLKRWCDTFGKNDKKLPEDTTEFLQTLETYFEIAEITQPQAKYKIGVSILPTKHVNLLTQLRKVKQDDKCFEAFRVVLTKQITTHEVISAVNKAKLKADETATQFLARLELELSKCKDTKDHESGLINNLIKSKLIEVMPTHIQCSIDIDENIEPRALATKLDKRIRQISLTWQHVKGLE